MLRNTLSVMCSNSLDDGDEKENLALGKVWEGTGFLKSSWNLWIFSPKMYWKIPMPTVIHSWCYCFECLSLSHRQHRKRNTFYKKIISLNIVYNCNFLFLLTSQHSTPILTPGISQVYYSPWNPQISDPSPLTVRAWTPGMFEQFSAAVWHCPFERQEQ